MGQLSGMGSLGFFSEMSHQPAGTNFRFSRKRPSGWYKTSPIKLINPTEDVWYRL